MSGYQQRRPAPGKQPLPARLADYRTVGERIDAFCADYPGDTCIDSHPTAPPTEGWIAFRATVSRWMPDGTAWTLGTGHAAQKFTGQEDQYEKLETAARGRALVAAGYTSSLEKAAEIEAATEKVNRQEGRASLPFTAADRDSLIPHEWRGRLDFDSDNPNAYRPQGQEIATTPRPTPQDAPKRRPPAEPLTEAQQEAVANAWDMSVSDTYQAVLAMLRTVFPGATPGQLTTLDDERSKIAAKHFPDAAIQKGQ